MKKPPLLHQKINRSWDNPLKRVGLVLDALTEPEAASVRCVIVGDGEEASVLRRTAQDRGLGSRVMFPGALPEGELLGYLAGCRVVCFPPLQEDYGLVTVEAFASSKAVITCTDSGGPAELVQHGQSGLVCAPDSRSLARALTTMMDDAAQAERLGQRAGEQVKEITWERALEQLLLV